MVQRLFALARSALPAALAISTVAWFPHGATAQAYGVFNDKAGMALRGTFLVNPEGIIVHKVVGQITARSWDAIVQQFVDGARP